MSTMIGRSSASARSRMAEPILMATASSKVEKTSVASCLFIRAMSSATACRPPVNVAHALTDGRRAVKS